LSLKDYIRIVKRHKWWIIGWVVLIGLIYGVYDKKIKKVRYTGTAVFRVLSVASKGEEDVVNNNTTFQKTEIENDIIIYGDSPDLREHRTRMYGSAIMKETIRKYLALEQKFPEESKNDKYAWRQSPYPVFRDNATEENNIRELRDSLVITPNYADKSFSILAHSTNRFKVKWLIDSFLETYIESEKARVQGSTKDVLGKNEERYEERKLKIQSIIKERELQKDRLWKQYGEHVDWDGGTDFKQEERNEILKKIDEVTKEVITLKSEIQEFAVYEPDRWLIDDGEGHKIVELQNELYSKRETLQQELAALRVDFTDKHPNVVRKLAELNSLNAAFPKLAKEIVEKKVRLLNRSLANKEALKSKLELDLSRVSQEIKVISEQKQKFDSFDDRQSKLQDGLVLLEQHIDKLQDELTRSNALVEVINEAAKEGLLENSAPNTFYYVLIFGIVIGFGFAYLLDYMDDTIRTPHDVEKFVGMRVIGTVPMLSKGEEKLLHRIALKSPISEMMNTLSMIIQSWMLKMKGQALLIVSSKPGEGKSTFITNLAVALCRGGEKVVLIDSDMRKPSLHRFFGVDNSVGFSNYLEDSFSGDVEESDEAKIAKIVHHTDIEGLFLIPSGPIPSNPVGLLKGENVERLLNHLKTYIGVILIDTPPLAMIDAGVLATKVNAVVTVMDAGKVSKREALAGKHLIENVGGNSIGVILNKVTLEGEEYYYYFEGYSYYYGNSRARKKKPV